MSEEAFMLADPFDGDGPEVFYDACNEIERLEGEIVSLRAEITHIRDVHGVPLDCRQCVKAYISARDGGKTPND